MSLANLINATSGGLNQGCWKRKGSDDDEDVIQSTVKKAKYSWYVTLESESSQGTSPDEDDESIHSVQEQETEYVQDTSDTSNGTWIGSSDNGDLVHLEYEVASLSEDDNPFNDLISSSCSEEIIRVGLITAEIVCDTDVDEADYSSDDSRNSHDSEFSPADYWTCMQCNASNNNPMFRCCEKCWRQRKNFFPPRPKGKKRRLKRQKRKSTQVQDSQELTTLDSGLGSSQSSQPVSSLAFSQESTNTTDISLSASQINTISMSQSSDIDYSQPTTNLISPTSSQDQSSFLSKNETIRLGKTKDDDNLSQESILSTATTLSIDSRLAEEIDNRFFDIKKDIAIVTKKIQLPPTDPDNELCKICSTAPRDGVIIHGHMAHYEYCCLTCAKKMWKTRKRCPLCNLRVVNVMKGYNASSFPSTSIG